MEGPVQFPYTDEAGRVWIAYGVTRDEYLNAIEGRSIYAERESDSGNTMTIDEVISWCRKNNLTLRANGAVHIPPTADEILADEVMRLRRELAAAERERDMYRAIANTGQLI